MYFISSFLGKKCCVPALRLTSTQIKVVETIELRAVFFIRPRCHTSHHYITSPWPDVSSQCHTASRRCLDVNFIIDVGNVCYTTSRLHYDVISHCKPSRCQRWQRRRPCCQCDFIKTLGVRLSTWCNSTSRQLHCVDVTRHQDSVMTVNRRWYWRRGQHYTVSRLRRDVVVMLALTTMSHDVRTMLTWCHSGVWRCVGCRRPCRRRPRRDAASRWCYNGGLMSRNGAVFDATQSHDRITTVLVLDGMQRYDSIMVPCNVFVDDDVVVSS